MQAKSAQLKLPLKPGKRAHGGSRPGAGRPNLSGKRAHLRRPQLSSREPVHVTLKLAPGLPSIRRKDVFRAFREAVKTARRRGFGVVHFALLSNHVHLILEPSEASLRSQLQSVTISFAKRLNRLARRKGAVFFDRYHLHILKTPGEVRNALEYVLTNDAKHRGERGPRVEIAVDPFSSADRFQDWKELLGPGVRFRVTWWSDALLETWYDEILRPARTWLLKEGWQRGRRTALKRERASSLA